MKTYADSSGSVDYRYDNSGNMVRKNFYPAISTINSNAYYKIESVQSGKVLDVVNFSLSDGALIQQYDYVGGANQSWHFEDIGNGFYYITQKIVEKF